MFVGVVPVVIDLALGAFALDDMITPPTPARRMTTATCALISRRIVFIILVFAHIFRVE
jgi:hypothetical protein